MIPNRYLIDSQAERSFMWIVVFTFNLFLPGLLGWSLTFGLARWGMLLGVVICLLIGWIPCYFSRFWGTLLLRGGWTVASLQFLPMMHMFIGAVAVSGGSRFNLNTNGHRDVEHLDSFLGGLLATGFTGGALMTISLLFGFIIQLGVNLVHYRWLGHRTTRT